MKVEYSEESAVKKSLAFEIEAEVVDREIAERARHYARQAKIPGFRPGKIPPDVIRKRYRQQVLEDVAEKLVNKVVHEELEGRGLRPLDTPRVTELKIDENQPLTFKAVFETLPIVELPDYKGLPAKARPATVSEDAVDKEVDRMRDEAARYDPVEGRALREGDFAVLDVTHDGAGAGKAKTDENVLVEVGSTDNHKDLNAGLVGMSPGESKTISLVYEESHPSKGLAGQAVTYTVNLRSIKDKVLPSADDEFAKDLGEFGSLQELREHIRGRLQSAEDRRVDREVKRALLDALVDRAGFEVPDALVARHMMARTENAARSLALQGVDPAKAGVDWKKFRDAQREESVKAAKADILLDEIARREGIEVLDGELDAEVGRYAEGLKKSRESVRSRMEKEGDLAALRARIREDKTLDLLKANARMDVE